MRYTSYTGKDEENIESQDRLTSIDLRVENTCNCACEMCFEGASSKIAGKRIGISKKL